MAVYAIIGKIEATREAGRCSWTKKSGKSRLASTGIRRFGEAALFAARPEWLMTREAGS